MTTDDTNIIGERVQQKPFSLRIINLLWRWGLVSILLAAFFWGIWSLFTPVPVTEKIFWLKGGEGEPDIFIHLPFALTRWWDVIFAPIISTTVILVVNFLCYLSKKKDYRDYIGLRLWVVLWAGLWVGLMFGLGAGLVFGLSYGLALGLVFGLGYGLVFGLLFVLWAGPWVVLWRVIFSQYFQTRGSL